jgi:hypothetical protein
MTAERILVERLDFRIFPNLEGEVFQEGLFLRFNGQPFPDKWSRSDWEAVEPGTRLEFDYHLAYSLQGTVTEVDWDDRNGRTPFLRIVDGEFQGNPKQLEKGSLGRYGRFEVVTYRWAKVEPDWLFPNGVVLPWEVYQSILAHLGGWRPFRQLSLSELWACVKYGVDCPISWSFENLIAALSVEGNFALPSEIRSVHNALKLAAKIKEHRWPLEDDEESPEPQEPELLNLWFDLESQKWIWLRPDSLFEDELGLSCAQFCREEFDQDVSSLALKLLFPAKEPFFSVRGQVFESTSGPF